MVWREEVLPLLQVHDDLLFEVEDGMLELAAGAIKTVMEGVVELPERKLPVPVVVEAKAGKRWGSMERIGE